MHYNYNWWWAALIPCTVLTPVGTKVNNIVDPLLGTRVLAALIVGFVVYKLVLTVTDVYR